MVIFQLVVLVITLNLEMAILSINLGTRIKRRDEILMLVFAFALMHCVVVLIGYIIGSTLNGLIGTMSKYISSAILIGVGFQIARKSTVQSQASLSQANILLILFGASIEDLIGGVSVGVGTFGGKIPLMMLLFFVISVPVNLLAFRIGRSLGRYFYFSVDFVTGILLIAIGVLSVFGIL